MTSKEFGKILQDKLTSEYGVELNIASNQQIYRSLALKVNFYNFRTCETSMI